MKTPKTKPRSSQQRMVRRRTLPPLMPYNQWRALGPEKAAEYLARRRGYSAERQGKLWAILEFTWNEPPNAEVSDRRAHGNENTTGANGGSLD